MGISCAWPHLWPHSLCSQFICSRDWEPSLYQDHPFCSWKTLVPFLPPKITKNVPFGFLSLFLHAVGKFFLAYLFIWYRHLSARSSISIFIWGMLLLLLLLLLSHFSRVRLCETLETAAHQAPPSLGFSRQEHWSGLPFPSPMHESEKWKWSCSVVSNS